MTLCENETRVFGPPGTGKTTYLSRSVRLTAEDRGTDRLVVGSFTRSAAAEIGGRGLPIPSRNVGTLHALAYRAIDQPPITEERVSDWNKRWPAFGLSGGYRDLRLDGVQEAFGGATEGDRLMLQAETYRNRMIPETLWPTHVRAFHRRWEEWKAEEELIDFTDMLEIALANTEEAPGSPVVGFFDEFQDFTPLEIALVRHWGKQMEKVIVAGDDDQVLYSFRGATPDAFLDPPVPDDQKRVLSQSHRVPRAVHAVAERWVRKLTRREEKDYLPRDFEGAVRFRGDLRWQSREAVAVLLAQEADAGRSVALLTTCAYMLDPVKHELRRMGVPFHNPLRRHRQDWNPLRPSRGTSAAERLVAYLIMDERLFGEASRLWTGQDVKRWAAVVRKQGVFHRGRSAEMIEALPDRELRYEEVAALFESEEELERAVEPSLEWFSSRLLASHRERMEYPIAVARNRGPAALTEEPRVVLGTIHSFKGGEVDVVLLAPDLSVSGMREWERPVVRDSVIRQMYVGMTRAREDLVVLGASSPYAVDPVRLLRG